MDNSAYISCPVSVEEKHLLDVSKFVEGAGFEPLYWIRGTRYDEPFISKCIENCDAFILVPPKNQFISPIDSLPAGCNKELKKAIKAGRKIYLAYRAGTGLHVYKTTTEDGYIKGIASTYLDFELEGAKLRNDFTNSLSDFTAALQNNSTKTVQSIIRESSGFTTNFPLSNFSISNEGWTINTPSNVKYDANSLGNKVHEAISEIFREPFYGELKYTPADRRAALLIKL